MGVSSSGKSTYIDFLKRKEDMKAVPVIMAYEIEKNSNIIPDGECIIHYNLFRAHNNDAQNIDRDFMEDTVLSKLLTFRDRLKVVFLVAPKNVLAKRILTRKRSEPILRRKSGVYPTQRIFELLCRINLIDYFQKWFDLLESNNIIYELIDTSSFDYKQLKLSDIALCVESTEAVIYSDYEIKEIVKSNDFEYQRIELPGGKYTKGQDRSGSLVLLDKDLSGKSILDIGCAYGFFSFEAERRNAAKIVGTELKRNRYIGANIIKEIRNSNVQFLYTDVFNSPLDIKFDVVLLLNVIHHLKEPLRALRLCAELCTEKLIIEFPTLSDEVFALTLSESVAFDPSLPIIGVSLQKNFDQTFLFSEKALERILLDHDQLFRNIEFIQSPMNKNRRVAICYK